MSEHAITVKWNNAKVGPAQGAQGPPRALGCEDRDQSLLGRGVIGAGSREVEQVKGGAMVKLKIRCQQCKWPIFSAGDGPPGS